MFQSPYLASNSAASSSANKENSNADLFKDSKDPEQEINTSGYSLRSRDTSTKKVSQDQKRGSESNGKRCRKSSSKQLLASQDDSFASGKDHVVTNLYSQIDEAAEH